MIQFFCAWIAFATVGPGNRSQAGSNRRESSESVRLQERGRERGPERKNEKETSLERVDKRNAPRDGKGRRCHCHLTDFIRFQEDAFQFTALAHIRHVLSFAL